MSHIKCNVIIDSCCDLPASVVDVPGVEVLQFPYMIDDEEFFDDLYQSISPHDYFERIKKAKSLSTAQIPIPVFVDVFTRAAQSGIPTVYLSFTSGLSGSCNTASLIADQVKSEYPDAELYVVDTKLASIAEGLIVYEAIRQRGRGLSAKELVEWVEEARYFVNEKFMVDDLDSLKRGGRIPASIAFAGSKLNVKPMLDISLEGKLSLTGVARGRKKGIRLLADFYKKNAIEAGQSSQIVIGHADCPKDVERLKEELYKVDESLLFLETSIGPVIGSHVGSGMIAIAFMGHDSRNDLSVSDRIAKKIKSEN